MEVREGCPYIPKTVAEDLITTYEFDSMETMLKTITLPKEGSEKTGEELRWLQAVVD